MREAQNQMMVLERLFERYKELQSSMAETHNGEYVVMAEGEAKFFAPKIQEAYQWAIEHYTLGMFIIQLVGRDSSAYTARLSPKVIV